MHFDDEGTLVEPQTVIVRDLSSGRFHKRTLLNGQLQSFEADNADQAGEVEIVDESVIADADLDALCKRCFDEDYANDVVTE